MIPRWFLLSVAVGFWGGEAIGQQAAPPRQVELHTLRYKFQPGQVLEFEAEQTIQVAAAIQGRTQEAHNRTASLKRWKVLEVGDDRVARIQISTQRLQMEATDGRDRVAFDSEDPDNVPEAYREVAEAIGKPLSIIHVSPRGEVVQREKLIETSGPDPTAHARLTLALPKQPLAVGESWSEKFEVDVLQSDGATKKFPVRQDFTLQQVEGSVATIAFKTVVLAPVGDPRLEVQLIQQQPAGSVQFDLQRGLVIAQTQETDKTVVGYAGPGSSFHLTSNFQERLRPAAATADRKP